MIQLWLVLVPRSYSIQLILLLLRFRQHHQIQMECASNFKEILTPCYSLCQEWDKGWFRRLLVWIRQSTRDVYKTSSPIPLLSLDIVIVQSSKTGHRKIPCLLAIESNLPSLLARNPIPLQYYKIGHNCRKISPWITWPEKLSSCKILASPVSVLLNQLFVWRGLLWVPFLLTYHWSHNLDNLKLASYREARQELSFAFYLLIGPYLWWTALGNVCKSQWVGVMSLAAALIFCWKYNKLQGPYSQVFEPWLCFEHSLMCFVFRAVVDSSKYSSSYQVLHVD